MRFWWVNHKQTWRQEIGGEYLWCPKEEKDGKRSQFYDNVRNARRGDLVLSYASGKVSFVGVVLDNSISAPKPVEFGNRGEYWSREGWQLPVSWTELPQPVVPKEILGQILPLLPEKYSPLNDAGNGNQKAYLAEISNDLFDVIIAASKMDRDVLDGVPDSPIDLIEDTLDESVENAIRSDLSLSDTERRQLCLARKGQGTFRKNVKDIERACRITGVDTSDLLIASHIKPWRSCQSASERLDGNNGLLLTPSIDRLFDKGYISFDDDGNVLISSRLSTDDAIRFGLRQGYTRRTFSDRQKFYLEYHRKSVFLP
jgi:putative restriction endonuclease